jgi:hypothetical protein
VIGEDRYPLVSEHQSGKHVVDEVYLFLWHKRFRSTAVAHTTPLYLENEKNNKRSPSASHVDTWRRGRESALLDSGFPVTKIRARSSYFFFSYGKVREME